MKVWKYKIPGALTFAKGVPTFLALTGISSLLPGQLVLEYSILMSMTKKVLEKPVVKLNHDITSDTFLIFATIDDWLLHISCKCPLHAPPIFEEEKRHQICAALILSFIFKLPLESCNS